MNLLFIDDDDVERETVKRILKQSKHSIQVVEANAAEQGLELARENHFDLILLDYQLPTMNGLEVLRLLLQSPLNSIAVVMLSHTEDDELALKCIHAGAQDFITKSEVTVPRLLRALTHSKERFRIEQELRERHRKLSKSHEQLRKMAEMDALTGLANRYMFETGLKHALPQAERKGKTLALVMLDLDKFKDVNDTLGHAVGDQLLVEVAQRLNKTVREGDLLCRLGGDEFAILVHDLNNVASVRLLTHRILASFAKPLVIEGCDIVISASIGIASYPECATDAIQLMKCADVAMYRSKEAGRNRTHYYSITLHQQLHTRVELERELYCALAGDEFVLYYQPQMNAESEEIIGVEALIRWQHPSKGLITPDQFITIAEEIRLIDEIGDWVLETACKQFHQWRQKYRAMDLNLSVAVNLSAMQLGQQDFVQHIKHTLNQYQIPPERLELELTESTLNRSAAATDILRELSELGIQLALDDFGTGYSSLTQLQKYPFKVLKIDKSFIQNIQKQNSEKLFVKAIIAFAKILGLQVVAEGVESEWQKNQCQELKIDRIQGYYFAKPMPASELEHKFLL